MRKNQPGALVSETDFCLPNQGKDQFPAPARGQPAFWMQSQTASTAETQKVGLS